MLLFGNLGRAVAIHARSLSIILTLRIAATFAAPMGMGLLWAAAVLGLVRLIGPILALAFVGAACLLAAAAVWAVSHVWRAQHRPTPPQSPPT